MGSNPIRTATNLVVDAFSQLSDSTIFYHAEAIVDDLIRALMILRKYGNPAYPTHCEHDALYVQIDPDVVSEEDLAELEALGFIPSEEYSQSFVSFRYGSA